MDTDNRPIPDIVGTIKEKHIEPIPRWVIRTKNVALWTLVIGIGMVGVVFLSLSLVDMLDLGPDIFRSFGFRRLPFLLFRSIPLIWTSLFALTILFGILAFRNTRHGYRYRALFVGSLLVLSIVALTFFAHLAQLDDRLDRAFESGAPHTLRGFLPPRADRWLSPQDGALTGRILETNEGSFVMETPRGDQWIVITTEKTRVGRMVRIEAGQNILVFGTPKESAVFEANFIRPIRNGKIRKENDANSSINTPYNSMRGAHDTFIQ